MSDCVSIDNRENPEETTTSTGPSNETLIEKKPTQLSLSTEDPRLRASNTQKKIQKSSGHGRNTESFDPKSTLVRPAMRVIIGKPIEPKWGRTIKHDDVIIVPNFLCQEEDWSLYNQLIHEMREIQERQVKNAEWISWHEGAHLISKNPTESKTFQMIQKKIADYFGIDNSTVGTRFNWYRDSADWKPFHHDSAAFNPQRARNQNITIGVSFGVSRELAFLHAKNNTKIYFPQTNGMMFSFGRDVNIQWKHGVNYVPEEQQKEEERMFQSKVDADVTVGRISIILWGNCPHVVEEKNSPPMLTDNTRGNGHHIHRNDRQPQHQRSNHYQDNHQNRDYDRNERDRAADRGDRDGRRERGTDRPKERESEIRDRQSEPDRAARGRSQDTDRYRPPADQRNRSNGAGRSRSRSRNHHRDARNPDDRDRRGNFLNDRLHTSR